MGLIWGRQDPGGPHVGPISISVFNTYLVFFLWEMPDILGQCHDIMEYATDIMPFTRFP